MEADSLIMGQSSNLLVKKGVKAEENWSDNWNGVLEESQWEINKWEGRCRQLVDDLGDFSDDWLKLFYEARQEMTMYSETELLPQMKAFFEACGGIARQLKKWRVKATKEF
uniref:Uncharacterized protein n=1 Tax=Lupinus angustifolius TaxID=3871 RepID=L0P0W3_LUPAN|nr:hypothetical protein [Lupinus angustifolius]